MIINIPYVYQLEYIAPKKRKTTTDYIVDNIPVLVETYSADDTELVMLKARSYGSNVVDYRMIDGKLYMPFNAYPKMIEESELFRKFPMLPELVEQHAFMKADIKREGYSMEKSMSHEEIQELSSTQMMGYMDIANKSGLTYYTEPREDMPDIRKHVSDNNEEMQKEVADFWKDKCFVDGHIYHQVPVPEFSMRLPFFLHHGMGTEIIIEKNAYKNSSVFADFDIHQFPLGYNIASEMVDFNEMMKQHYKDHKHLLGEDVIYKSPVYMGENYYVVNPDLLPASNSPDIAVQVVDYYSSVFRNISSMFTDEDAQNFLINMSEYCIQNKNSGMDALQVILSELEGFMTDEHKQKDLNNGSQLSNIMKLMGAVKAGYEKTLNPEANLILFNTAPKQIESISENTPLIK